MSFPVAAMLLGAAVTALEPGFAQEPAWPAGGMPESQSQGAPPSLPQAWPQFPPQETPQYDPQTAPHAQPPRAPLLSPDQLDDLVAPVALYPDSLLGQALAASTYPLEIAEAGQWLGQNGNLQGARLMDAARAQNWDASIQAIVAFPDALALLSGNVRWTTDLGNAFLAQQAGVLAAVQRMRARAMANGMLRGTPEQAVTETSEDGQSAIQIAPADPQVIYVPVYSPAYVWGPPASGSDSSFWYPALRWGFGFARGILLNSLFPGLLGWNGWGWGLQWLGRGLGLLLNLNFFDHFGFHGGSYGQLAALAGGGFAGRVPWTHDPGHRVGVPYPNLALANRFGSARLGSAGSGGARTAGGQYPGGAARGAWQTFGNAGRAPSPSTYARGLGSANRGYAASGRQPSPSYGGYALGPGYRSSPSYGRSYASAPRTGAPAPPRPYSPQRGFFASRPSSPPKGFSAPRSFGNSRSFGKASRFSGGFPAGGGHFGGSAHSGGHSSGGHSSGGHAGRHGGGGHHR